PGTSLPRAYGREAKPRGVFARNFSVSSRRCVSVSQIGLVQRSGEGGGIAPWAILQKAAVAARASPAAPVQRWELTHRHDGRCRPLAREGGPAVAVSLSYRGNERAWVRVGPAVARLRGAD